MKRQRIVLDTNVMISAILFGGPPREVLELVINGTIDCSLSLAILDEFREVIRRPKFGFSPEQSFDVLEELRAVCDITDPIVRVDVVTTDPDDNRILECAVDSEAAFVVTGDSHLLDLGEFQGVRIVTPTAYLQAFKAMTLSAPPRASHRARRRR